MPVTLDNSNNNSGSTSVSSGTVTLSSISANSVVLVVTAIDDDGTTTLNVPTATGLTFVQIGATLHVAGDFYAAIYRAFTGSALGSTVITSSWNTTLSDWNLVAASISGTAGTAANNGSDAIGTTNSATAGSNPSVVVASSAHDNSKYFGAYWYASSATKTITPAGTFSTVTAALYNNNFIGLMSVLSTNPVTPPASTTVNATIAGANFTGVFGVELLVSTGPASTPNAFDSDEANQISNDVNFSLMQEADDFPTALPPPNVGTPSDNYQPVYTEYIWLGGDE